jgi:hypothetical protein
VGALTKAVSVPVANTPIERCSIPTRAFMAFGEAADSSASTALLCVIVSS